MAERKNNYVSNDTETNIVNLFIEKEIPKTCDKQTQLLKVNTTYSQFGISNIHS